MEEAILNSLLRYKNQLTPVRDTYPLPIKNWSTALRTSTPIINYSTYYIFDSPSLKKTIKKSHERALSYASTNALSPDKRSSLYSPIKQLIKNSPKKIPQVNDIKKIIQKDMPKRPKIFRNARKDATSKLNDGEKKTNLKSKNKLKSEFEEYKKEQGIRENNMREEIENLNEMLKKSTELTEESQQNLEE
ncbi:hypothetical protein SteCoe_17066 [Stentor coeruleus]|uniref:Uncharacterized protein n=1 Tax=Stentor coeruleus TaxID=5963 RepID=A0A1R2C019_9CILI|nr:hypothetical protein SteCoe_17066 [Stentor coeruleus]